MAKRFGKTKRNSSSKGGSTATATKTPVSGRNTSLAERLATREVNPRLLAAQTLPAPDTKNISGNTAYKVEPELRLLAILNTSKVEDQFYRDTSQLLDEVCNLIDYVGQKDALLLAKMIVYSRCYGTMRSINHFAAAYAVRYFSGQKWAKAFFTARERGKKSNSGGTIWRMDDMSQITNIFTTINGKSIPNSMVKGFRTVLEGADAYSLLKYKRDILDTINLVHPNPSVSEAMVDVDFKPYVERVQELLHASKNRTVQARYVKKLQEAKEPVNGKIKIKVLDAIIMGLPVSADTWEANNSQAGQLVAEAVREGKLTQEDAKVVLNEQKAENWKGLLLEKKLGILAAIRNLRNILNTNPTQTTINMLCSLLTDVNIIKSGKILPFQIDIANEIVVNEFGNTHFGRQVSQALYEGYMAALPNLAEAMPGRNLVMIDLSGSMWGAMGGRVYYGYKCDTNMKKSTSFSGDKALLMASTIAKATNADVIIFGSRSEYVHYNPNMDVFTMAKSWKKNMGDTNIASAWDLARQENKVYDRVVLLSDYEANRNSTPDAYKKYVAEIADPYVYQVDLGQLGTVQLKGDKVRNYFGYSFDIFEDMKNAEFNAATHLEKVKAIHI